jgi:hypothetical protein
MGPGRDVGSGSSSCCRDHAAAPRLDASDDAIRDGEKAGRTGEALFFDFALDDLTRAADLFRPVHQRTNGVDGWVSLEVSPLLPRPCVDVFLLTRHSVGARWSAVGEAAEFPNVPAQIAQQPHLLVGKATEVRAEGRLLQRRGQDGETTIVDRSYLTQIHHDASAGGTLVVHSRTCSATSPPSFSFAANRTTRSPVRP